MRCRYLVHPLNFSVKFGGLLGDKPHKSYSKFQPYWICIHRFIGVRILVLNSSPRTQQQKLWWWLRIICNITWASYNSNLSLFGATLAALLHNCSLNAQSVPPMRAPMHDWFLTSKRGNRCLQWGHLCKGGFWISIAQTVTSMRAPSMGNSFVP